MSGLLPARIPISASADFRFWPYCDIKLRPARVRFMDRKALLKLSSSLRDPIYKRAVLHQCIRSLIGAYRWFQSIIRPRVDRRHPK